MILWVLIFGLERVACHVNYSHGAHCQTVVPEVQLDEKVRLIVAWIVNLVARFLEVLTVLLDPVQQIEQLMRLNTPSIFCQF